MRQMENITSNDASSSRTRKNLFMIKYINASLRFTAYLCILLPVSCLLVRSCNKHKSSVSYCWDEIAEWKQPEKLLSDHSDKLILSFPYPRNCSDHADCCELMNLQRFLSTSVAKKKWRARNIALWISSFYYFLFFYQNFKQGLQMVLGLSTVLYNDAESRNAHWRMKSKRKSNCFLRSLMA